MGREIIPEVLEAYLLNESKEFGYELVDFSIRGGKIFSLLILLDKPGGISLDECVVFNKKVISWIEEQDMFANGCSVDVCSPGLDRKLKTMKDFLWAKGRDVLVTTYEPVNKKKQFIGKLDVNEDAETIIIIVEIDEKAVEIDIRNVAKAKLHFT